ncbi:hypothetical protein FGW37_18820 [Streptomyces rectiverticillatus]|uniref:Tn3 family transposase n=1 Tax=Streptomyces rectiverticillatus TaxID=173860 RepID=UPI0015C3726F|nr:hypothetical protein FGW37_18820 [Streptomyces rectiverticillatus]
MLEAGRAQQTILGARYLRLRDLPREIEEDLNVRGPSNGAGSVIACGKGGEIASDRRDEQEMFVLCLQVIESTAGGGRGPGGRGRRCSRGPCP